MGLFYFRATLLPWVILGLELFMDNVRSSTPPSWHLKALLLTSDFCLLLDCRDLLSSMYLASLLVISSTSSRRSTLAPEESTFFLHLRFCTSPVYWIRNLRLLVPRAAPMLSTVLLYPFFITSPQPTLTTLYPQESIVRSTRSCSATRRPASGTRRPRSPRTDGIVIFHVSP